MKMLSILLFFNLGGGELFIIGGLILLIGIFRAIGSKKNVTSTLILRRFKIEESTFAGDTLVEIVGRTSGFMGWLLTILGLSPETTFIVSRTKVSYKGSSLSGETHQVVPLPSVASTHCGYTKSILLLILGIIILLGGLYVGFTSYGNESTPILFGLIVGGIFLVSYWLSKKITIQIETSGGLMMGIAFKRSIIENIPIDIEQALKVIKTVNDQVVKSQIGNVVL